MRNTVLSIFAFFLSLEPTTGAAQGSNYTYSPSSRSIQPASIYQITGNVTGNSTIELYRPDTSFVLTGPNASITFDFGGMTAGIPTINFIRSQCHGLSCSPTGLPSLSCSGLCQGLGVAYSESAQYIGRASDNSTYYNTADGTVYVPMSVGKYTLPAKWGRGSMRYMTLSLGPDIAKSTSVELQFSNLYFNAQPNVPESQLQHSTGYFSSSDDLLNRIWAAGVYTLQLCTISANSSVEHLYIVQGSGWAQSSQVKGLDASAVFIADGAKRDRNPWAGDLDVAAKSMLVSHNFNNLQALRNSLSAMISLQDPISGYFPYAGSPLGNFFALVLSAYNSDTYHLWTIAGFCEYVALSNDTAFANKYWAQIVRGIEATYPSINATDSLFHGTRTSDWGRVGQGGANAALNAIYYHTLTLASRLATTATADPSANKANQARWQSTAAKLKTSFNALLYDRAAGLYRDNTTTPLHPQDGNAHAINFNLTASPQQRRAVARALAARLAAANTPRGPAAPELPGAVSPFASSQELRAHFAARPADAAPAMALMRTVWGYMLQAFGNETFVEGYGADGGLDYPFYGEARGFVSHAHAWSTGPVYSLMADVVGLRASAIDVANGDGGWSFWPKVMGAGVERVSGGFETAAGKFEAEWEVVGRLGWQARVVVPAGMTGTLYVPLMGRAVGEAVVKVDGKDMGKGDATDGFLRISGMGGGEHSIVLEA